jgi:hypothetical protein
VECRSMASLQRRVAGQHSNQGGAQQHLSCSCIGKTCEST